MADEPDTLLSQDSGTDNVETSQDDTPEDFVYYDPDDEESQDTVEDETAEGTDDEDGKDPEQPAEDSEDEPEEDQNAATEAAMDAKVRLADGTETTVEELIKGHTRQADYTRKTQELATRRKALEASASQVEGVSQALVDALTELLPPEPDMQLAYSDPGKYTQQKVSYDSAMKKIQEVIETGKQAKSVTDQMSQEDRQSLIAEENQKLAQAFPETATADGRKKFFNDAMAAATELGIPEDALASETDHRYFAALHWARKGMEAERAKASAKAKVNAAPKVPPKKPGQGVQKVNKNRDAIRNLRKTGSLDAAVAVDWD